MATFDQLAPDQRAIIELVLRKGRSYEEIGGMLDMSEQRVRDLARGALGELSPATARRVDSDWRGQLVDYVLGQQTGPEAAATRGHLKRSEAARMWAFSLLDSLDDLYGDGERPEIPEPGAERARRERPARAARGSDSEGGARTLSPAARSTVKRRRLIAAAVGALAVLAAVLLLTGVVGGDDDDKAAAPSAQTQAAQTPDVLAQAVLAPVGGEKGQGAAIVTRQDKTAALLLRAELEPSKRGEQYYIWLYNDEKTVQPLAADASDKQGNLTGAAALPENWQSFRFVDITRQKRNSRTHGNSVMRGPLMAPSDAAGGSTQPPGEQP